MKNGYRYLSFLSILFLLSAMITEASAVGALFSRPRWSTQEYRKMWIKSMDATVDIQDQIAVTHVDQVFYNEMNQSVEAIFMFPLPENAMITELVYWVNGVRYEAQIRERQDAINDYNQKLRQWLDPALLEYLGDNLFRLSIVPINALSEVRTEITYAEPLKYDLGTIDYTFLLNTTGLSSKPLETVSVSVDAKSQTPFKKFDSPTHHSSSATKIEEVSGNHYTLFYGDENFYPDKDLKIEFETIRDDVEFRVLTYTPTPSDSFGTDSFYALWITPPDSVPDEQIIPKDIVFTADVSSSMEGERMDQLKEALDDFLNLLNPSDRFNIITFGTYVQKFKPDLVPVDDNTIAEARQFVLQMYALGMTNIDEALQASMLQDYGSLSSNNLIFLTDGKPTFEETNTDVILDSVRARNTKDIRIFPFGIGETVSESFLTRLGSENHGYAKFITSDDSIALVVRDHFNRISKPVLRDISIDTGGLQAWDQYPKTMNDLFWGSQVTQVGLYKNSGMFDVILKGVMLADTVRYINAINFPDTSGGHRFVPRLWAKAKIDHILELIAIYGETDELVNQIIELSLRFQILTPYTAFYVDPTAINDKNPTLKADQFTLSQNYPNPFNPSTEIKYALPHNQASYHVVIKIYDTLGRLIVVLVDSSLAPGSYTATWNGKDLNGNAAPSGIYFYTIQAGPFKQTRKMMLLR